MWINLNDNIITLDKRNLQNDNWWMVIFKILWVNKKVVLSYLDQIKENYGDLLDLILTNLIYNYYLEQGILIYSL